MKLNDSGKRIETTLGELIATISDVAFESCDDTEEAYTLALLVSLEILKRASFTSQLQNRRAPSSKYPH